jgi:hypothetical protein
MATTTPIGGNGPGTAPGASPTQTTKQGQPRTAAVDATLSAINNGLQGAVAALSRAATEAAKRSTTWSASMQQLNASTQLQIKTLTSSENAIKSETDQRKIAVDYAKDANAWQHRNTKSIADELRLKKTRDAEELIRSKKYANIYAATAQTLREKDAAERKLLAHQQKMLQMQQAGVNTEEKSKAFEKLAHEEELLSAEVAHSSSQHKLLSGALADHHKGLLSVTSKLRDFAKGLALGATTRKLYDEAQQAKTTGNYANAGEFLRGQKDALMMGVGSQVYNEITANARSAQLTTKSPEEFNKHLTTATDTMQTVAGSREEGAKLSGELFKHGANIGITMNDMGKGMDGLGETFKQLSKVTGKTAAEMAQLSVSIMNDSEHREQMLGMSGQERAIYVQKMTQDLLELKVKGYSIEQAQELQKIALREREKTLAEKVGQRAKAQQAGYVVANILGGESGAKVRDYEQRIGKKSAAGKNMTDEERQKNDQEIAVLRAEQRAEIEKGRKGRSFNETQYYQLNQFGKTLGEQSEVKGGQVALETGSTEDQKRAKAGEGNMGDKGSILNAATTAEGYATALASNTAALWALTAVMSVGTIKDAFSMVKANKGAIKGKAVELLGKAKGMPKSAMNVANRAGNAIELSTAIEGGGQATRMAKGAGYASDVMKASKLIKGAAILAPIAGAIEGYSNYDAKKKNAGESIGLGVGSAAGGAAGGWAGAAGGAAMGAALGSVVPVLGTGIGAIVGGIIGGVGGGWGGSELGGMAGKYLGAKADKTPEQKAAEDAATVHPEQAKDAKQKATLEDLQKQYYQAALDFYKDSDPKVDAETRTKHAAALQRLASNAQLAGAGFNTKPVTGG